MTEDEKINIARSLVDIKDRCAKMVEACTKALDGLNANYSNKQPPTEAWLIEWTDCDGLARKPAVYGSNTIDDFRRLIDPNAKSIELIRRPE